jgi:hypothetical protein
MYKWRGDGVSMLAFPMSIQKQKRNHLTIFCRE